MTNLTDKEQALYNAIKKGMDEPNCGWLHELAPSTKETSGIVSSLVKKGLITSELDADGFNCYWVEIV